MPEPPEVETTRRGLEPLIVGRTIMACDVRERRLRWPVESTISRRLEGRRVHAVERRAKYLLFRLDDSTLIFHLGMSGSLRFLPLPETPLKHDHLDIRLLGGGLVRYNDPRRFGSIHLTADPESHPLLRHLGCEPLGPDFDAAYLRRRLNGRKAPIKSMLMDSSVVAGIGNIYANEALFLAGIHPMRAAGRISATRLAKLVDGVRAVLGSAIDSGGTTLRDFVGSDGRPGYFRQSLEVYERSGEACSRCTKPIKRIVLGQRATYYCPACQR
jgi:formamidopyrimidine-DNA glycosylase